jgi:hypothetical protein
VLPGCRFRRPGRPGGSGLGYDSRIVRRSWLTVGALGTLAFLAPVAPASGYQPPELPWANCSGDIAADLTVIEARALPEEGAKVVAGTQVTFSTPSAAPVTFSVASSPALLASPNIDQGLAQSPPSEDTYHMQVFTSSKAASTPGTVYWQASFSAAEVPGCAGVLSGPITNPPRTLTVEPAPPPPLAAPPPAPVFSATIGSVPVGRPQVAFEVHCSTSCVGTAAYVVTAFHHHRKIRERALDCGPWKVAIASSSGGVQQFAHRYTGASLRKLKRLIYDGDALEVHIASTVRDAGGTTAVARTTARLD